MGFLLGVGTFRKEGQAAGQEGAAQSHQVGLEDSLPQELQDTDLARWLLQMSQTCWLPAKHTTQSLRHKGPERPAPSLSTLPPLTGSTMGLGKEPPQNHLSTPPQHYAYLAMDAGTTMPGHIAATPRWDKKDNLATDDGGYTRSL